MDSITITGTTNGSGAATATGGLGGAYRCYAIVWTGTALTSGADIVITAGGQALLTLADGALNKTYHPRALMQSVTDGADLTAIYDYPVVADDISITVAAGGATKAFSATIYLL